MKILAIIVGTILGLGGAVGGYYYFYVTSSDSPYDEAGITLNQVMPGPVSAWGCAQLEERFAQQLPPLGCQAEGDQRSWR
ncbi:hypothetical protein AAD018_005330 [Aestuariibius insulae]|uniref:hypothetical protein n=1 Tax=Aestuariibius insulae TaxID=2058287 RepID=UPI00345ECA16